MNKKLKEIYQTPKDPGSFGGVHRLYQSAKGQGIHVNVDKVKDFLKGHRPYTLHKPARKNYSRNPIIVSGIDVQWQADLVDMQSLSKANDGINYILTVIDCFSKFAWALPLKSKSSVNIKPAFTTIFENSKRIPIRLQTDKGTEFLNQDVQALFKKYKIAHFTTDSETKAAIVERFNRTLKTRMWTYFTSKGTDRYVDVLEDFLDSYNHSRHRTIGMCPANVKKQDEKKLFQRIYAKSLSSASQIKDKKGPYVRISKNKATFEKGYRPNWSGEIYKVSRPISGHHKAVFELEDIRNNKDRISGRFYPEELQSIEYDPDAPYPIEKIVKSRMRNGIKEVLVKWEDYPDSENSWIKASELEDI